MKKSLYFLFILALFCLTGCKDALVPKPIKLTCNINTFDAPISCISRSTADADKLYIGQPIFPHIVLPAPAAAWAFSCGG